MKNVYLMWDPTGDVATHTPEAFLAPTREAAVRRFETMVATAMAETTDETREWLKRHPPVRAFIELGNNQLNYLGFRLAAVNLQEYK